jgi:hypothetical protein
MPRISKGPRLYKRKTKRKNGRIIASAVWTIRDGEREVATGILAGEAERKPPKDAEDALAKYITSKYQPSRRIRDIEDIDIADVLAIYHAHREGIYLERKAKQSDITEFADRIGRLNDFFGGMMLVEVNAHTCAKTSRRAAGPAEPAAIWKICAPRSIIIRARAFTAAWFVWHCRRKGVAAIDG